jgi:hypothetical protein
MLIAGQTLDQRWQPIVLVFYFVGLMLLIHAYRRRTGIWTTSWNSRSGRRWVMACMALVLGSLGVALAARFDRLPPWTAGAAAFVAWLAIVVIGPRYDRAERAAVSGQV